jgi:hypothetical protein
LAFGVFDQPFGAAHSSTATIRTLDADCAEIDMAQFLGIQCVEVQRLPLIGMKTGK